MANWNMQLFGAHPFRSHDWVQGDDGWSCIRSENCSAQVSECDNCGRQHDPTATVVVCTVVRRIW